MKSHHFTAKKSTSKTACTVDYEKQKNVWGWRVLIKREMFRFYFYCGEQTYVYLSYISLYTLWNRYHTQMD